MTASNGQFSEDDELQSLWDQVGRNTEPNRLKALKEGADPQGPSEEAYVRTFKSMHERQLFH